MPSIPPCVIHFSPVQRRTSRRKKTSRFGQLRRCMFQALIRCVCDRRLVQLAHGVSSVSGQRLATNASAFPLLIHRSASDPSITVLAPLQSWQYETRPPLPAFVWQSAHMLPVTQELHPTGSSVPRYELQGFLAIYPLLIRGCQKLDLLSCLRHPVVREHGSMDRSRPPKTHG